MASQKLNFSNSFRRMLAALEQLSEDDITKIGDESYSIEIRLIRKRKKEEPISPVQGDDLTDVIDTVTAFASWDEAQQFLKTNFLNRKSLELIARKLDIPISRQDKVQNLRDKVVETTFGARIRSQVIQGTKG
jgi:hypothetical protein